MGEGKRDPRIEACARKLWDLHHERRQGWPGRHNPYLPFENGGKAAAEAMEDAAAVIAEWLRQAPTESMVAATSTRDPEGMDMDDAYTAMCAAALKEII